MKITYKSKIKQDKQLTPQEIIDLLLKTRKIKDVDTFLKPPSPLTYSLNDFGFKKKEIDHAMQLLQKVKEENGTIVVYTDYDADGITGGAILWETLHLLGFKAMPYVPHRKTEGYGFSKIGIDKVKKEYNPALIISVDHGIAAVEQIAYAKEIGIPIIVTDHHHKQEQIPEAAEAIFHIPALSGSGTAYMVAKEIFEKLRGPSAKLSVLEKNFKTDYLALATIGTVADLVPLVGASRSIVSHGLAAFGKVNRVGLKHICKEAEISIESISPYEIGFIIAPRINAVGRLEHAIDALRLLCTTNDHRAFDLASKISHLNTARQDLVKQNVEEAVKQVEAMKQLPNLLILHSDHWHEGVIGLIASQLVERYYRPTMVLTRGDGHYKASARSIHGFHMTNFLTELSEYLENYGGHAAAAGFSLLSEQLNAFKKAALQKAEEQITDEILERTMVADLQVPVSLMKMSLAQKLESLAPFGVGNPKPTFASTVELLHAGLFGKTKDHVKLQVKDITGRSFPIEMIAFGKADIFTQLSRNQQVEIVYQLDINRWNGRETLRGMVKEIIV